MSSKNILAVLVLIALLISGCGKRASQSGSEVSINLALSGKIKSLDPLSLRDVTGATVAYNMFEQLYQYHYLKRPYEAVPLLADGMPQISEDKLTYTIKIKKGVLFQDDKCFAGGKGRELSAQDFVYGIKRIADIKNLSENWASFDDKIKGLDEFREYTKSCAKAEDVDYSKEIEGLDAPDNYTIVFKLKKPWPNFLNSALTDAMTSPIAKEAVDCYGKDIISHPVATGPYMLKVWNRGSYVELVRNPNFRGEPYPSEGEPDDAENGLLDDAGKIMPFVDKVKFRIIEESQPSWLLFMQGHLDIRGIQKDDWSQAMTAGGELTEKMKQLNIELITYVDPSTFWLGFNMEDPVLGKNKPLRQAISFAIDRQKFIDLFLNGRDQIAHGFVAPMLDSYDPNISRYGFSEYNPDKAKKLLIEAEKINGGPIPPLTVALPGTESFYRQFGEFFTKQFEDVGLKLEVELMDWPTYQNKVNKKQAQMFSAGVSAGSVDAEDFLQMFYSKRMSPGPNKFNYSNSEFDKLYEEIEVMFESPERIALYRQMELMVLEDYPAAFLNHRVAYALKHEWYKNYKPYVFGYNTAKYRRIDLEKKAAYKELLKKVK